MNNVGWAPFLDDQLYVKFGILDRDTPEPKIYFINSNTYVIHATFFNAIGASVVGDDSSGEIVFNPNQIVNGVIGTYSFNFSFVMLTTLRRLSEPMSYWQPICLFFKTI